MSHDARQATTGEPCTEARRTGSEDVERLRQRVAELEDIIRSLPFGLIFIDADDRVAIANPIGSKIRCVGDRLGGPVSACHPPGTHGVLENVLERFKTVPADEQHPIVLERMNRYEVTYSRVSDAAGAYRGVLWIAADISRRKQLEAELLHAERLAGLGRMAAKIAHDIKNPLSAIQGAAHYLQRSGDNDGDGAAIQPSEVDEMTGLIKEQVARIASLLGRLGVLTRPLRPNPEPTDLAELLERQARSVRMAHPEVRCTVTVEPGLPQVEVDGDLVGRLVANAAANAVAAMDGRGSLRLEAIRRTRERGSWIELRAHDDGPGFPEEVLASLYQPFVTTRPDGTGLGLTIMREICLLHGGDLEVESSDHGATIVATLAAR